MLMFMLGAEMQIYKRSAFIILSYREYEKRRGMNEKNEDEAIA